MFARVARNTLSEKENLSAGNDGGTAVTAGSIAHARRVRREPFLRIPPFPGAKAKPFAATAVPARLSHQILGLLRDLRVGGTYWAAQPELPPRYLLVRSGFGGGVDDLSAGLPIVFWDEGQECDPWHMLSGASALVTVPDDEVRLVAAILGVPTYVRHDTGAIVPVEPPEPASIAHSIGLHSSYVNPFTGEAMSARDAVELCGFWRALIDSNRDLAGGLGFAFWKQGNVAPLLWGGSEAFRFLTSAQGVPADRSIAVWRSKASPEELAHLEQPIVEVEDGFLRSQGLGADCVPPLSITVDRLGAYFDPAQPSELELLLQDGAFDEQLLERARTLRALIVEAGLGKYEQGRIVLERRAGDRRHILVPGQVEDDRSVLTGGGGLSNLELLRRVRQDALDAYILYKPHPDVVAGHRKGAIPDRTCLGLADEIVGDLPISSLIEMVDQVHVNTSLAGFEALMREKPVTAYGVPFYAGWGLTLDKGPVPARRTARRTIDELVAAALLLYPRYLDPLTGLPCPAEVVVRRLTAGTTRTRDPIVMLRRLQGKLMRRFKGLVP